MKELTHFTFSAGACVYLLSLLDKLTWSSAAIVLWLSLAINYIIDALGHSRGAAPSRTRITHSVFTAPLWGALVSFISIGVTSHAVPSHLQFPPSLLWIAAGISIAMMHLLLDSLTQAGVFYWKSRIALAHFRYDNLALNAGFAASGFFLIVLAVAPPGPLAQPPPIHLSLVGVFAGTVDRCKDWG
jgi:hypothetical protein